MLKILHIISASGIYGAENSLLQAMRYTPGTMEGVLVFSPSKREAPLARAARALGFPAGTLPNRNIAAPAAMAGLHRFMREFDPHILHSHGYKELLYGWLFSLFPGRKLIHTNHGFVDDGKGKKKAYHLLELLLCRSLSSLPVVVLAESTRGRFLSFGIPRNRVHLIRNSIHPEALPETMAIPDDLKDLMTGRKTLAYIGRLSHEKGPDLLIRAMGKTARRFPDVMLLAAGDGYLRESLESLAAEMGIGDHIRFLGFREDAKAIMANSTAIVIPSRNEAIPRTLMEGMLMGRPVVAAAAGGIPDVIEDRISGVLVLVNGAEALAGGICRVLADPVSAMRMGERARIRIRKDFNAEIRCAELADIYASLHGSLFGNRGPRRFFPEGS
jgi:glycosyltransferase involved in cell wall biosynthesis